jgi:hypothetical protein
MEGGGGGGGRGENASRKGKQLEDVGGLWTGKGWILIGY